MLYYILHVKYYILYTIYCKMYVVYSILYTMYLHYILQGLLFVLTRHCKASGNTMLWTEKLHTSLVLTL